MTLIFDSDEERNEEDNLEEIIDNDFKKLKNNMEDEYFLNEDSLKIERGSSVNPQISNNSFNGDSSLMLLASNLANY